MGEHNLFEVSTHLWVDLAIYTNRVFKSPSEGKENRIWPFSFEFVVSPGISFLLLLFIYSRDEKYQILH